MTEKNKHHLLWFLILITTVPFLFIVKQPTSWGFDSQSLKTISLYVSAVFGYAGISLLIWELVLGIRSISSLYFRDIGSKIRLHRWLGTYGLILILLHPLLITYSYGETFLYSFIPILKSNFEIYVTLGRFAFFGLILIWFTSITFRAKIKQKLWKYIHYLSYPILILAMLHVPKIGSSYNQPWIQFFWQVFVFITAVTFVLRFIDYLQNRTRAIART